MPSEPSNETLATMITGLKELVELKFSAIEEAQRDHKIQDEKDHAVLAKHLAKLNGQVAKNTEWRIRGITFVAIITFIVPLAISVLFQIVN